MSADIGRGVHRKKDIQISNFFAEDIARGGADQKGHSILGGERAFFDIKMTQNGTISSIRHPKQHKFSRCARLFS